MFCFAVMMMLNENTYPFLNRKILFRQKISAILAWSVTAIIIVAAGKKGFEEYGAVQQWKQIQEAFTNDADTEKKYEALSAVLGDNGKFLTAYTKWMAGDSMCCKKAVKTAEQSKEFVFSRESMETAAKVYGKLNDHAGVSNHWERIGNYLPGKFNPKYQLMKAYLESGDTVNARQVALKITAMPVKVNSMEVKKIKERAEEVLRQRLH